MSLIVFFFTVAILSFSPFSQKTAAAPSIEDTPMTGRQLSLQAVSTVVEETAEEKEVSKAQGGSKVRSPDPKSDDVKSEEEREEIDDDEKQELDVPDELPVPLLPYDTKEGQLLFEAAQAEPKRQLKLESTLEKLKDKGKKKETPDTVIKSGLPKLKNEVNWFDHSKIDTEKVKKEVLPSNVRLSSHAGSALKITFEGVTKATKIYFCLQDVLHAQDVVNNFNGSKTDNLLTLDHISVVEQYFATDFGDGSGMRIIDHARYLILRLLQYGHIVSFACAGAEGPEKGTGRMLCAIHFGTNPVKDCVEQEK